MLYPILTPSRLLLDLNGTWLFKADDGTGFDVNEKKDDGRSHVGMENIRRRLQEMCGAEVIINSTIGEGTVATVVLPKEEQHHENTVR